MTVEGNPAEKDRLLGEGQTGFPAGSFILGDSFPAKYGVAEAGGQWDAGSSVARSLIVSLCGDLSRS